MESSRKVWFRTKSLGVIFFCFDSWGLITTPVIDREAKLEELSLLLALNNMENYVVPHH